MNYIRLRNNLVSVIKESLIKLGYDGIGIGVNYVESSLLHLIDGVASENLYSALLDFADENKELFGEIIVRKIDMGYRLDVSSKGVEHINSMIDENEFLVRFINEVRSPVATIDSVVAVFNEYSDRVHVERTESNPEFDYLIYFEQGVPDEFWYCIDTEDLGMTYHRFMKDDYLDFDF